MKFTNKHNFPAHICNWCATDEYDYVEGTISATTLIAPAKVWALKKLHANELEMDYSDLLAIRYGTAIHDSLEKAEIPNSENIIEKRFFAEFRGYTISGKMDAVRDGVIRDNKSTSVWKYTKGEFEEYIKQLSIYRWLLKQNKIETASYAIIDFFFTDWKKSDAKKGGGYPSTRYAEQRIELWSLDITEQYIDDRLLEFTFALSTMPDCTTEELWQEPTKYAVYKLNKDGSKQARANRVLESLESAEELAKEVSGIIEERPSKAKRCGYCVVSRFCDQYKRMLEEGLVDE